MTGAAGTAATGSLKRSVNVAVPVPPGPVADRPMAEVPVATADPEIRPVVALMTSPAGRPVAA